MHVVGIDYKEKISDINIFEADCIVYDPNASDSKAIGETTIASMESDSKLIDKYLEQKKLFFCFMPIDEKRGKFVNALLSALGIAFDFKYIYGSRMLIDIRYEYFSEWFEDYQSILLNPTGKGICFVEGTDECLGVEVNYKAGKIILLPSFGATTNIRWVEVEDFVEQIDLFDDGIELPEWTREYQTTTETYLEGEISKIAEQVSTLEEKAGELETQLEADTQYKLLFAGMGTPLEKQTKAVFEELGFSFIPSEINRADHIMKYKRKIAVVEVKGIEKKSAAEKNAAQLEKWVTEFICENEGKKAPKGILVANAFAGIPLEKRTEEAFPQQMLKYVVAREHCLITGMQMYNIHRHIMENPNDKEKIVNQIFSTVGRFEGYDDWRKYLCTQSE